MIKQKGVERAPSDLKSGKQNHGFGTRHERKLRKFSKGFNEMFSFFLKSYRCGILTFCGSFVEVDYDKDGPGGKESFRKFDNGDYKFVNPVSKHPNVLKAVIIGKKSWGLWCQQWGQGIGECLFTKDEVLFQFEENGIKIPDSFIKDFENTIFEYRRKRIIRYLENFKEEK